MKRYISILTLLTLTFSVYSQISFEAGGVAFETDLHEINAQAQIDFGKFKVDIAGGYNIDEKKIEYMSAELSMDAAEIYLACEIGRVTDQSIDDVVTVYAANRSKGWGYIAQQMGIDPGSDEFHALKETTDSYYKSSSEQKKKSKNNKKNKKKK